MSIQSLNHLFFDAVRTYDKSDAFRYKVGGRYVDVSHRQAAERVRHAAIGLLELGVTSGDRIGLLSENRLEWAIVDYAVLTSRAVCVPVYPTVTARQVAYVLANSGAEVAFISTAEQLDKILSLRAEIPSLRHIVTFDELPGNHEGVMTLAALEELGRAGAGRHGDTYEQQALAAQPDDLATLIYTSGTTGNPKGVMLTHGNIAANVESVIDRVPMDASDTCLSFLPLSHILERMAGHFLMLNRGVTIAYAESVETVQPNMLEVRPTVMISVPRLYEKIYARVNEAVAQSPPLRQKLFRWAMGVGWRAAQVRLAGGRAGGLLGLQCSLADKLVFGKLRARTGGRIRFFVSGGAPLSPEIARFFFAAGFTVYEGYGLTETSPVIAVNEPGRVRIGTVGPIVPGVDVRLAEDGEILVRGANVMLGYYNDPAATAEVLDDEGWLSTGDIGFIDGDGFLRITDRKKDLLVTAGGKNVAPQPIENLLKTSPYIAEAVVLGDRQKFTAALLVPAFEGLQSFAAEHGVDAGDRGALATHPAVVELLNGEVDRLCADLAQFERPKQVRLVADEFTIENGELTPTLKVRRKVINERYHDVIASIYDEP